MFGSHSAGLIPEKSGVNNKRPNTPKGHVKIGKRAISKNQDIGDGTNRERRSINGFMEISNRSKTRRGEKRARESCIVYIHVEKAPERRPQKE